MKITSVHLLWSDGTVTTSRRRELLQATVVGVQVVYSVYSPTVSPADLDTLLANPTTLSAVNSNLVTTIPAAVVQAPLVLVPSSAPTMAPTFSPTVSPSTPSAAPTNYPFTTETIAPTSGPPQASSSNAGVVAASVVGSIAALAAIVGGLWFNRKVLWKKIMGDKRTMVVPVDVDMDVISVVPPPLIDSQKECQSHSIRIWGSEKSEKSPKSDNIENHKELQKVVVPIPISEAPTRIASPRSLLPLVTNDDTLASDSYEADKLERANHDSPQRVMEGKGHTSTSLDSLTNLANISIHHSNTTLPLLPGSDDTFQWLLDQLSKAYTNDGNDHGGDDDVSIIRANDDTSVGSLAATVSRPISEKKDDEDGERPSVAFPTADDVPSLTSIVHLNDADNSVTKASSQDPTLAIVDEVTPFVHEPLSPAQSPVIDKSLTSSVIGLSKKPTAAPIQREKAWTKGKIQPVATDIDENISVPPRSSKQAFAAVEAFPEEDNVVISDFARIGDDDEFQASLTVQESIRDIVDQDSEDVVSAEEQMVEIRKKIKEKKALLLAAQSDSKGKGPTSDTRISNAEEE